MEKKKIFLIKKEGFSLQRLISKTSDALNNFLNWAKYVRRKREKKRKE